MLIATCLLQLDLHGRPLLDGRTHTKLAQTARKGSTELWLTEPVDWCVGDPHTCQIGLSSTHQNGTMWEYETSDVVQVTNGGRRLVLGAELQFDHLGETRQLDGGYSVEFRCNVAVLSSNVVVQGETTFSRLDRHGAQIFLHSRNHRSVADQSQGDSLVARISNIEIRYAGQFGRLGRYPIHVPSWGPNPGLTRVLSSAVRSFPLPHQSQTRAPRWQVSHDWDGGQVVCAQHSHPPHLPSLHCDPWRSLPEVHGQCVL